MRRLSGLGGILMLPCLISSAAAQGICRPGADSHEAATLAILSVPIAFTGASAPMSEAGMSIGMEAVTLPTVNAITATPTACRPGKGPENTHPIPGLLRPRVQVAIGGVILEASWIPPVTVNQVKANLFGVAVSVPRHIGHGWDADVRVHGVFGDLHAPVTCDDAELGDPSSECFHGHRSNDRWQPGVFGAEVAIGTGHRLHPYLGMGYSWLRPRFQVDFTNAAGDIDHTEVEVDLQRIAVFGGVTWLTGRSSLTAEAYSTPADAVSARVVVRVTLGRVGHA